MSPLAMLAMELSDLADLAAWPPVGALAEGLLEALGADQGFSSAEVARVRRWAAAWRSVPGDVRGFYARHADDPVVWHCLRRLLDGGPEPGGASRGRLVRLWEEDHGEPPVRPLWWRVHRSV